MEQYIPKAAVVAEIDRWRDEIKEGISSIHLSGSDRAYATFEYEVLGNVKDFLDTIEVKEVDLSLIEPHIKEEWNKINTGHTYSIIDSYNIFVGICTYFYELGLNARKEE